MSRRVLRVVVAVLAFGWWLLAVVGLLVWLLWRGVVWLARLLGFVAGPADELVTAWVGMAPVLPRVRRWQRRLAVEWRADRAGVVDGELMDGVWR